MFAYLFQILLRKLIKGVQKEDLMLTAFPTTTVMHIHAYAFHTSNKLLCFTSPIKLMTCLPDKHQPHQPVSQRKSDAPGSRTNACCTKVEEGCRTAGSPLCRLSLLAVPETLFCRLEREYSDQSSTYAHQ